MQIKQARLRSARRVLERLLPDTSFRVTVARANLSVERFANAGFSSDARPGDSVLPASIGVISEYNANGRFVIRRDLPKELRYVTTVEWSWEEWAGRYGTETRTEDRPVYRKCFQRDFEPPPASELTIVDHNGDRLVVSEQLVNRAGQEDKILHIVNLFLELFRECEIRHADLQALMPPKIRRVNWALLPPGQYPWSQVRQHVTDLLEGKAPQSANPIHHRLEKLASFNPDEVYVGNGGFRSYVSYIFAAKDIAVLESVMLDNATYIFDRDWKEVSQMTKAEILQGNLQRDRIIHSENWNERIDQLLR